MILLLGSNNQHKAYEIEKLFKESELNSIDLKILSDFTDKVIEVEESGNTLEENASIKAKFFYELFQVPTVADDTGLEVNALDGLPGVKSARFSGPHGNDKANRAKLINILKSLGPMNWSARFRTVICLYDNNRGHFVEGICYGRIIDEERGDGGFGYDSIFIPDGYSKTFAEMSLDEKNSISHRGRAIRNLANLLKELYR